MIKVGNTGIADMRLGSVNVVAAYLGDKQVWQKGAEICQDPISLTLSLRTDGIDLYADIQGNMKSRYELCRISKVSSNRSRQNAPRGNSHGHMLNQFRWHVSHGYYYRDKSDGMVITADGDCLLDCPTLYPRVKNVTKDGDAYRLLIAASTTFMLKRIAGKKTYVNYGIAVYDRRRGKRGNGTRVSNVCFYRVVAEVQPDLSLQYRIEI